MTVGRARVQGTARRPRRSTARCSSNSWRSKRTPVLLCTWSVMADQRNVWTVPLDGGGWAITSRGSPRVMDRGSRKADVQKQGRERARKHKLEHIIQKQDGTIGERNSYGGDSPRRPG